VIVVPMAISTSKKEAAQVCKQDWYPKHSLSGFGSLASETELLFHLFY
jgi:hypothetical protein